MQRLLMVIVACASALALSASAVLAAPAAKVDRAVKAASGCPHGEATMQARAMKPAKTEQKHDRGKHLGQNKHEGQPGGSDSEEVSGDHERKQNHGWFVSRVARGKSLAGRAHEQAVSEVARSDQGKPEQANH